MTNTAGVRAVGEGSDLGVEVLDGLEDPSADGLALDDAEPAFDEVKYYLLGEWRLGQLATTNATAAPHFVPVDGD